MKKPSFDIPAVFTALRTAGALIAGNGIVQLYLGSSTFVVLGLLATGLVVIVATSLKK